MRIFFITTNIRTSNKIRSDPIRFLFTTVLLDDSTYCEKSTLELEMIVSALLTSVGINLGLCVLFIAIYSILRKQPWNVKVYAPRSIVEGKAQNDDDISLERFLPSTGWLVSAWSPSEDEFLAIAGLDAVVFMRIFILWLEPFFFLPYF